MSGSGLGLSSSHERSVSEFLHFARFKRGQCVRTVEAALHHLADSRLVEDTFTCDEVREMLEGLCGVVKAEVDSELINFAHTHAILLRQLFQTADRWHLILEANISELENRELLAEIAQFEKAELSSPSQKQTAPSHKRTQLEPLNYAAGEKLLHMKINELEDENRRLRERCQTIETKASSALSEKDRLKSDMAAKTTTTGEDDVDSGGIAGAEEIAALQDKIAQLQTQLGEVEKSDISSLKDKLSHTSHELLRVTAELKETKEELDKKFGETAQYVNLMKMLASKNNQIKKLREKVEQYESGGK